MHRGSLIALPPAQSLRLLRLTRPPDTVAGGLVGSRSLGVVLVKSPGCLCTPRWLRRLLRLRRLQWLRRLRWLQWLRRLRLRRRGPLLRERLRSSGCARGPLRHLHCDCSERRKV